LKISNKDIWTRLARLASDSNTSVYLTGGAIRDALFGRNSIDSDFLVLGSAKEFAEKASRKLNGGRVVEFPKFGSAFFVFQEGKLEFCEPRIAVEGKTELEIVREDMFHRDFTINALSAPLTVKKELEILDATGGLADIQCRILRTPLEPLQTFREDPLRILRAFRFENDFNLRMVPGMTEAISTIASQTMSVAGERLNEELNKILLLPKPSRPLKALFDTGVLHIILPEVAKMAGVERRGKFNHKDIFLHSLRVLDNTAVSGGDLPTRLSALFHDIAKPSTKRFDSVDGFTFYGHEELGSKMVVNICRRLRYSSEIVKLVQKLTRLHMRPVNLVSEEVTDSAIRRLMFHAGEDLERLLTLCRADITSGNPLKVKLYLRNFDNMVQRMREVEAKDEMCAFQSPVRGDEIMELCAIPPGPKVGQIKTAIEKAILDGIIPNDYNSAKEYFLKNKERWMKGEFES
jgi:tRNA nucleotidyltransferase/poly(A) polymerase